MLHALFSVDELKVQLLCHKRAGCLLGLALVYRAEGDDAIVVTCSMPRAFAEQQLCSNKLRGNRPPLSSSAEP